MTVEGPEFKRAFRGAIQHALNSEFFRDFRIETCSGRGLTSLYQGGCVCGPANWMRQIFDISACAKSLFIFA